MIEDELRLRQRVRVNVSCPLQELIGDEGIIVGMRLERDGAVNITVSTNWPKDVGDDGWRPVELDVVS
jgi:hypothetical protein